MAQRPLIAGLTGGIGSGKSAAASCFEALGISVVDADIIARDVVMPHTPCLEAIHKHFGSGILNDDKSLNRHKLRNIIFANSNEKRWLEELLHPAIRALIIDQLKQSQSAYSVLVSPLLLETNQHELVNRIIVVDCPETIQISRASKRDKVTDENIKAIMATQLARQARLAKADDVLHNDGDLNELHRQVETLHNRYMANLI
ncbi:dephospho-CoA kinase [Gilvimarinus sp. SDUM040013]|uniref:Dephospho-CoA kinase n=1 Tax=Gilvimarinus gilvus TaxID=3058038 RepID=A0ABU4RY79_9GAMM|nr:dephospho-CoA kinase [Gilvimarinus sp. SDUM040013]MDO3388379.1 dephospho-CoA kinase [Gilvimarinus sp. SDUM040013]MDX6847929.1 dephospho-CoA kinase [Gilvimarinus sp. SDUM040013]